MKEFEDASQFFENILEINPDDKAAQIYLKRCQYYKKYEVSEDWDGIECLVNK
ncbi:MAG: hypothetical protein QM487_14820 [Candidatus Marithrix sp.]